MPDQLATIRDKIESGQRLSAADGEFLFRHDVDLHAVGELADVVRRRKHGDVAYYNLNAHLNPTNVCVFRCALCAYSCDPDDARAYFLTDEQVMARARRRRPTPAAPSCTSSAGASRPAVRLVCGHDRAAARGLPAAAPEGVDRGRDRLVRAPGAAHAAVDPRRTDRGRAGQPAGRRGRNLRPRGPHGHLPAQGRRRTWLAIHRTAHELGLRSNATMLYGAHRERRAPRRPPAAAAAAAGRNRRLPGLRAALRSIPRTRRWAGRASPRPARCRVPQHHARRVLTACWPLLRRTGLLDLRMMAVSRLMLDNFDHIKAYWISLGIGTAQVALGYGADDLDGTVRHERIHHDAGAESPEVARRRRNPRADPRGRPRAGRTRHALSPRRAGGEGVGSGGE